MSQLSESLYMQPGGTHDLGKSEALMSDRPNALAADSHSYLFLANFIPLETQDPDDTFVYGARVYNSQYQLHTSPIEHMKCKTCK